MVDDLAQKFAILRVDRVSAMVAGRTLVDKVAPGRINYEVPVGCRIRAPLRSGTDRLNQRLMALEGAGGHENENRCRVNNSGKLSAQDELMLHTETLPNFFAEAMILNRI